MKALFKKDMLHCKGDWILLAIIFPVLLSLNYLYMYDTGLFTPYFSFLLMIIMGTVPISTLNHDRLSGWLTYASALPHRRRDEVNEKYLLILMLTGACLLTYIIISVSGALIFGISPWSDILSGLLVMVGIGLFGSGISFPFAYIKGPSTSMGVYFLMLFGLSGISGFLISLNKDPSDDTLEIFNISLTGAAVFAAVSAALFALSYFLSLRFREKYDLK